MTHLQRILNLSLGSNCVFEQSNREEALADKGPNQSVMICRVCGGVPAC